MESLEDFKDLIIQRAMDALSAISLYEHSDCGDTAREALAEIQALIKSREEQVLEANNLARTFTNSLRQALKGE